MSKDIVLMYVCLTVILVDHCLGEGYVVVLLFYVHGKHPWSCRDGQLPYPHFSWAGSVLLSGYPILRAHALASN